MDDEELYQALLYMGEVVEYGERWTPTTTHEWWRDADGNRRVRLVQTYHGGGNRGDDDEAEYVQRLRDMGRSWDVAVMFSELTDEDKAEYRAVAPPHVTHVITIDDKPVRIRYYVAPPEGVEYRGPSEQ